MMTMGRCFPIFAAIVGLLTIRQAHSNSDGNEVEFGKPQESVVDLSTKTFGSAINDPANPIWLLKFYAPWCGHCKRLAPVLRNVAPKIAGQMAIGTVDCTSDGKKLCNEHKVRGYPTLKFSVDGQIHDYPGGRSEKDIIAFAAKMNRPALSMVSSVEAAMEHAKSQTDEGIVFLAHHPQLSMEAESVDKQAQSTLLTQVVAQVARKQRAFVDFLVLDPNAADGTQLAEPWEESPRTDATGEEEEASEKPFAKASPFLCRLEALVPPRCYSNLADIDTEALNAFVQEQNVPTVSKLGPNNFSKLGRQGKPLMIAVVKGDDTEQVATAKAQLAAFALEGDQREDYYYGYMDGIQWKTFLSQFNVATTELPQVLALNVPGKIFWQNATYALNVDDFAAAIADGTVAPESPSGSGGFQQGLRMLYYAMIEYRPWSVILVVLLFSVVVVAIASCMSPGKPVPNPNPVFENDRPATDMPPVPADGAKGGVAKPEETTAAPEEKKDK